MSFREYVKMNNLTDAEVAEILDLHVVYLNRILAGEKHYSKKVARAVERFTQGKVKAEDIALTREKKSFMSDEGCLLNAIVSVVGNKSKEMIKKTYIDLLQEKKNKEKNN
jgi:DNA-binding transcriptional regulator YdaS (Cro superfamily)